MAEKIIDTMTTSMDIPPKEQRAGYLIPFIKPTTGEPQGGNFSLDKLLDAEATQEELDAKADKTYVDAELKKKVDATTQAETDRLQNAEISKKANASDMTLALDKKVDESTYDFDKQAQDAEIALKANRTYVDEELGKKVATATYNSKMEALDTRDREQDARLDDLQENKADVITNTRRGLSPLVCTDSDEEPFLGMKIYGKTEQKTTEGNQLFNFPDKKVTVAGITWESKNGVVTVKGTSTELSLPLIECYVPTPIVGTYTWTGNYVICRYSKNGKYIYAPRGTINFDGTETDLKFYLQLNSGITVNDVSYPMLNKGSSPLPFEPYTGGKPSPSPEYPQEIVSAGASGSIETKVAGKNLFDKNKLSNGEFVEYNGVPCYKYLDGPNYFRYIDKFEENQIYTLNIKVYREETSGIVEVRFIYTDGTEQVGRVDNNFAILTSDRNKTIAQITGTYKLFKSCYIDLSATQLEVGSEATSYEPYKPIQTATASTPNGLNGMNGVYDEKNYETGKQTQRFYKYHLLSVSKKDPDAPTAFAVGPIPNRKPVKRGTLCNRFTNNEGKPVKVSSIGEFTERNQNTTSGMYFLFPEGITTVSQANQWLADNPTYLVGLCEEPIVTDIPKEEMDAYHALHSNNPTTTVWNEDGTEYELDYRAETKRIVKQMASDIVKNEAIYEMGENYIKYANGTAMCWGKTNSSNVTYPMPFVEEATYLTARTASAVLAITSQSKTGFSTNGSTGTEWVALGKWR